MMAHETWIRISTPAEPADRDRAHPGSATVGVVAWSAAACDDGRDARTWATTPTTAEIAMITTPTAIADSCQNWNGKSWTSRSVAGSKSYEPAGNRTSWKTSKSVSNATSAKTPRPTTAAASQNAPCRTARQVAAVSFRRTAASSEHDHRDDGRDRQAAEHRAHVAHVSALPIVQDRDTRDRDVEVGRPDDQVGEDRVRGGPQVGLAVAGPRLRLGATLLEADPGRRQERDDRDRDDDDRRGDPDRDGGGASAEGAHRAILARPVEGTGRRALSATRPRGSGPGPTSR